MRKFILLSTAILSILILQSTLSHALPSESDAGHLDLSNMSSDIKNSLTESKTNGLRDAMNHFSGGLDGFKQFISSADVSEDDPQIKGALHFYDPATGYGFLGLFPNARNRSHDFYRNAVINYCANHAYATAWDRLGHAMHLLQDMTTPAHTNNESHIFPPDTYEEYVRLNWDQWDSATPDEGKIIKEDGKGQRGCQAFS